VLSRLDDPSAEVRQAAVLAAGVLKLTEAIPRLIPIATKPGDELRSQAISALCLMPDPRAIAVYRQASKDDDPSLRRAGERALQALPSQAHPGVVRAAVTASRPALEAEARRRFVLDHPGDARKGEELFQDHQGVSCASCHTRDDSGPNAGVLARKRTKAELIDALLSPSDSVAAAHRPMGRIESSFSALEFTDLITWLQTLSRTKPLARNGSEAEPGETHSRPNP
jgi:hypothetical protein